MRRAAKCFVGLIAIGLPLLLLLVALAVWPSWARIVREIELQENDR